MGKHLLACLPGEGSGALQPCAQAQLPTLLGGPTRMGRQRQQWEWVLVATIRQAHWRQELPEQSLGVIRERFNEN